MKKNIISLILGLVLATQLLTFSTKASSTKEYIIQPGDVLWKIGHEHNTTWQVLAKLNQLKNPNLIYAGDTLLIPTSTPTSSSTHKAISLRIMHTNDHHSHLESSTYDLSFDGIPTRLNIGGFSNLATIIDENRHKNTIVLNSGELNGTLYFSLFKGEVDFKVFNKLGIDAYALGNHEFDEGDGRLAELIKIANFPIVSSNVQPTSKSPLYAVKDSVKPYVIKEIDGEKIGIIGILKAEKTKNSSLASDDLTFSDEIETARQYVAELEKQGVNKIILLSHVGYYNDFLFAEHVPGIDIIVGGDSHSLLGDTDALGEVGLAQKYHGQTGPLPGYSHGDYEKNQSIGEYPTVVQDPNGDPVYIVTAWEYAHAVGMLDVDFDKAGKIISIDGNVIIPVSGPYLQKDDEGKRVEVSADVKANIENMIKKSPILTFAKPSRTVESIIAPYRDEMKASLETVIGHISTNMSAERIPTPFASGETPTGSMAAYVVAEAFATANPRIDVAIQNVGGVRSEFFEGQFTVSQAITTLPFSNTVVMMDMTGEEIANVLNQSAHYALNTGSTGAFPAAANLRYDVFLSEEEGKNIQNIEVINKDGVWSTIDPNKTYTVSTNSFTALGKDNYLEFAKVRETEAGNFENTYINYYVPLKEYIEGLPNKTLPPVNPEGYCLKSVTK
ncbi:5'-nucleotidase C-terminal domain-containing protein [Vallitalea pronyensis]|uniref:5'-nucleotidase C-terminal domain-containing protein n=1 Tax=Vallitalea pronyensis TaxID=1348613 RepID=A0A8J8MMC1_9FIRM|nr:5'-nucleotidase C-terminal domain-containing protein [Vallitalea pronyensis]QUI24037.1 5'-nucleotidase C-terminal domain-containing protein [Vallitalea pronyensis]